MTTTEGAAPREGEAERRPYDPVGVVRRDYVAEVVTLIDRNLIQVRTELAGLRDDRDALAERIRGLVEAEQVLSRRRAAITGQPTPEVVPS